MGIFVRLVMVAVVASVCFQIFVILEHANRLGLGSYTVNHSPGPCRVFHVNGSEDIDLVHNGLAIFTSGLRYSLDGRSDANMLARDGKMYAFDFNHPDQPPEEIKLENFDKSDFNPAGLDVYMDPMTNETLVFVVNRGSKYRIEIFQFNLQNLVLQHKKTVWDKNIYHPNDVVAVGPESFYATNDLYFSNPILKMIESFYPFDFGTIAFYDGHKATIVAKKLKFANGIDIDKHGKYVYAASGSDNSIYVYERNADNSLEKRQEIFLGSIVDNLNVDPETGNLLTAGLTQAQAYMDYNKNLSRPCPSKVFMVKLSEEKNSNVPHKIDDIIELYSSNGKSNLKCASTALLYNGKLLIGTIFDNLMYCEVLTM